VNVGRSARIAACVVMAGLASARDARAQLTLRGWDRPLEAPIASVDEQGVGVLDGEKIHVYSWDRVQQAADPRAEAFLATADTLWRARARLTRGDIAMAEPALEQAFQTYAAKRGATSSMIAEALTRARLWRGGNVSAVGPWLVFLACGSTPTIMRDPREAPGGYQELPSLPIDPETGLIPELPPLWSRGPASAAFARTKLSGFPAEQNGPDELRASTLGALYQAAAAFENDQGATMPVIPPELKGDKAVGLVSLIVSARISDDPVRTGARRELERELTRVAAKPWLEAWLRVAIARSLLRDQTRQAKLEALAQLAHLPARLSESSPALTAMALSEMAIELNELGETGAALAIRDELVAFAPDTPALEQEPMRRWPRSKPTAQEAAP